MLITNHTDISACIVFSEQYTKKVEKICNLLSSFHVDFWDNHQYYSLHPEKTIQSMDSPLSYLIYEADVMDDFRKAAIIIDKEFCANLGFTNDDILGAIAHEFGHFLCYFRDNLEKGGQVEEIAADGYAAEIGLGENLLCALIKMSESGLFRPQITSQQKTRIAWIKNYHLANARD